MAGIRRKDDVQPPESGEPISGEALRNRLTPPELRRECHCPQCDYDLRGQMVERCPECGFQYDLSGLRAMQWERFYSEFGPLLWTAKVLAVVGFFLVLPTHGVRWIVAVLLVATPRSWVEEWIMGSIRPDPLRSVRDVLIRRAWIAVAALAIFDAFVLALRILSHL